MSGKCKVEKVTMLIPCRVFACGKPSKYRIGNPEGSPSGYFHLCEDCAESMIDSLVDVVESLQEAEQPDAPEPEKDEMDSTEEDKSDVEVEADDEEAAESVEPEEDAEEAEKEEAPKKSAKKKGAKK